MEYAYLFKNIFLIAPILGFSGGLGETQKAFGPIRNWPKYDNFGQVSAVGVDDAGNVYVFHRGNRRWDATTFKMNDFADRDKGPILNETIVILEPNQGTLLKKTGANLFYLPHGLTVDADNNIWVTDVALHQVFKFPPVDLFKGDGRLREANLTLGVPFEPGKDDKHFCKPTAVAVDRETKEFYVSDGYCNARIIKFDRYGNQLLTFGRTSIGAPRNDVYMFNVPHALALAQEKHILFVADRENLRVVSYDSQYGKFNKSFAEELRSRIFSVAYSPLEGGFLFALANDQSAQKSVSVYNSVSGKFLASFYPDTNFTNPHDLAVSPDGQFCYVVELNPYRIWKFKLGRFPKDSNLSRHLDGGQGGTDEPLPFENRVDGNKAPEVSSSFLAGGLIVSVMTISCLIFMYHYYKRKGGHRSYESRRLILDDDEGGIRLT